MSLKFRSIVKMYANVDVLPLKYGAIFLTKRGKRVTVIDDVDTVGDRMPGRYLSRSLEWLKKKGVRIKTGVTFGKIDKHGIDFTTKEGVHERLDCGSILIFKSPKANLGLYEQVKGLAPEVYTAGSCNGTDTSLMVDAMQQGCEVGCRI